MAVVSACAPSTQLLVVIERHDAPAASYDAIDIEAMPPGGPPPAGGTAALGARVLPVSFAVVPARGADDDVAVHVRATSGAGIQERMITTRFRRGRRVELHLDLSAICDGVTCNPDETCIAGACERITSDPPRDASAPRDVGIDASMDAGPVDAPPCIGPDGGSMCVARCGSPPACCTRGYGPIPNVTVPVHLGRCFASLGVAIDPSTAVVWRDVEPTSTSVLFELEAATGGLPSRLGWHWADEDPHDPGARFELFACPRLDRCATDAGVGPTQAHVDMTAQRGYAAGRPIALWMLIAERGNVCTGATPTHVWSSVPAMSDEPGSLHALAYVDPDVPFTTWFAFEDLPQLGDFSYADVLVRVRGARTTCR